MENATVIFKNPEDESKSIEISLVYNKETSEANYEVKLSDCYKDTSAPLDFIGFLAKMFLESLTMQD